MTKTNKLTTPVQHDTLTDIDMMASEWADMHSLHNMCLVVFTRFGCKLGFQMALKIPGLMSCI